MSSSLVWNFFWHSKQILYNLLDPSFLITVPFFFSRNNSVIWFLQIEHLAIIFY